MAIFKVVCHKKNLSYTLRMSIRAFVKTMYPLTQSCGNVTIKRLENDHGSRRYLVTLGGDDEINNAGSEGEGIGGYSLRVKTSPGDVLAASEKITLN